MEFLGSIKTLLVFVRLMHWVEYPKTKSIYRREVSERKESTNTSYHSVFVRTCDKTRVRSEGSEGANARASRWQADHGSGLQPSLAVCVHRLLACPARPQVQAQGRWHGTSALKCCCALCSALPTGETAPCKAEADSVLSHPKGASGRTSRPDPWPVCVRVMAERSCWVTAAPASLGGIWPLLSPYR